MPTEAPTERQPSTWPPRSYIAAALWGWLSLSVLTATLCRDDPRPFIHLGLLAIWLARLAIARLRRERNRVWVLYLTLAVFAVPIWFGVEKLIEMC